jgi:hypothetical protein
MKVQKPHLQIILIAIMLDLPVGIDAMPYTRASKLKLKESRQYGSNSPVALLLRVSLDQNKSIPYLYYDTIMKF